jgi:Na+/H+-translocating membrane pyrophosphatase
VGYDDAALATHHGKHSPRKEVEMLREVYEAISAGAEAFLFAEYSICALFVAITSLIIFALISWSQNTTLAFLTSAAFVLGAITSIASGYIGMRVAVFSNVRTTINAQKPGYEACFNTAFRAGSVMGFGLTGLGILVLYLILMVYRYVYVYVHVYVYVFMYVFMYVVYDYMCINLSLSIPP